ncbi:hypothetical protein HYX13_01145, partial [Candidatus Woesearchaeota archaeon]|nr:hypothetical protein [Candidatus Woesearchaeota archaeon]
SGQIEIYSKVEERELGKFSAEDDLYFFMVISFAASVVFESIGAQGTNIIIKSGMTDDHPSGKLCAYILPRKQNDGLDGLLWQPKQPSYDIDSVVGKIKDKTWKIKFSEKKEEIKKKEEFSVKNEEMKTEVSTEGRNMGKKNLIISSDEEIRNALEKVKKG